MKKQKPLTKQEEIMTKHWVNPLTDTFKQPKRIKKMMDEWAIVVLRQVIAGEYNFSTCYNEADAKDIYLGVKDKIK